MLQILPFTGRRIFKLFVSVFLLAFVAGETYSQCGNVNFPNAYPTVRGLRQSISTPSGHYNGLIEWLPANYNSTSGTYPVIIYFHGAGAVGDGTPASLCGILMDQYNPGMSTTLPNRIENGGFGAPGTVPSAGGTSFIVIAPQYESYGSPYHYADETEEIIDYVVNNYRVDESRIYLTGMSTGANNVIDYLSSSVARAQRIAAASFGALCLPTNLAENPATAAQNVAVGDVATWFVHCQDENTTENPGVGTCGIATPNGWVTAINSNSPTTPARQTTLMGLNAPDPPAAGSYPARYNWCQGFRHDAWTALYAPDFNPTSGAGPSLYSWFLQFQQESALPVVLKSFTARLSNGKVYLRWVTTSEQENEGFVIERAGSNGAFGELVKVGGNGNSSSEKVYEYVDENPLANLSFYRLKQQDADGRNRYFDTRKVMNRGTRFKSMVVVTPNPFTADPSAFVNVEKKQRVTIWLSDMSGRVLSTVNNTFEEGQTELSLPTGSLPRGVYFIKVKGESITETHKIIKQ